MTFNGLRDRGGCVHRLAPRHAAKMLSNRRASRSHFPRVSCFAVLTFIRIKGQAPAPAAARPAAGLDRIRCRDARRTPRSRKNLADMEAGAPVVRRRERLLREPDRRPCCEVVVERGALGPFRNFDRLGVIRIPDRKRPRAKKAHFGSLTMRIRGQFRPVVEL